jgi:hypothetical protein
MRATRAQIGGLVAMTALAIAGVTAAFKVDRRDQDACDVLSQAEVKRIAGVADPAEPFETENTGIQSTGCSYGRGEPGVYVTVFSVAHGGFDMMQRGRALGEAHGAAFTSLKGHGYEGYTSVGPRERSESAVVVKHDHYVEVLVYNAPPGTAKQLAIVAARRLG